MRTCFCIAYYAILAYKAIADPYWVLSYVLHRNLKKNDGSSCSWFRFKESCPSFFFSSPELKINFVIQYLIEDKINNVERILQILSVWLALIWLMCCLIYWTSGPIYLLLYSIFQKCYGLLGNDVIKCSDP